MKRFNRAALGGIAMGVVLPIAVARAQFETPSIPLPGSSSIQLVITPSFYYGMPQKLSLDVKAALLGLSPAWRLGPFFAWGPGTGGTRLSLGYQWTSLASGRTTKMSAAFLKNRGTAWHGTPGWHAGAQGQIISGRALGVRVGALHGIGSSIAEKKFLFTLDISLLN